MKKYVITIVVMIIGYVQNIISSFSFGEYQNIITLTVITLCAILLGIFSIYDKYHSDKKEKLLNRKHESANHFIHSIIMDNPQKWLSKLDEDVKKGYITEKEKQDFMTTIKPKNEC